MQQPGIWWFPLYLTALGNGETDQTDVGWHRSISPALWKQRSQLNQSGFYSSLIEETRHDFEICEHKEFFRTRRVFSLNIPTCLIRGEEQLLGYSAIPVGSKTKDTDSIDIPIMAICRKVFIH
jgi:hypothetical protein